MAGLALRPASGGLRTAGPSGLQALPAHQSHALLAVGAGVVTLGALVLFWPRGKGSATSSGGPLPHSSPCPVGQYRGTDGQCHVIGPPASKSGLPDPRLVVAAILGSLGQIAGSFGVAGAAAFAAAQSSIEQIVDDAYAEVSSFGGGIRDLAHAIAHGIWVLVGAVLGAVGYTVDELEEAVFHALSLPF